MSPPAPLHILHLEDSRIDHELVRWALRHGGLQAELSRVETLAAFEQAIREQSFDAILADYHLSGFTARDAWALLAPLPQAPPFILLSGAIGEAAAVDAIRDGMADYVLKDSMPRLAHVVRRAIDVHQARQARQKADAELARSQQELARLADHLQVSIERERAEIAREIHDDIGGALAAIKLDLAWIGRQTLDAGSREHLQMALDMLQHAIGASQRIMKNLRPAVLDQGLDASIRWLASGFERRTGIPVRYRGLVAGAAIPKALEQVAFRAAQEGLTNVAKHAQASAVHIDLSAGGGVLTLEVADDGQGLPEQVLESAAGFGLKGLRERAHAAGGWVDIASAGRGTSVILSLPLPLPPSTAPCSP